MLRRARARQPWGVGAGARKATTPRSMCIVSIIIVIIISYTIAMCIYIYTYRERERERLLFTSYSIISPAGRHAARPHGGGEGRRGCEITRTNRNIRTYIRNIQQTNIYGAYEITSEHIRNIQQIVCVHILLNK